MHSIIILASELWHIFSNSHLTTSQHAYSNPESSLIDFKIPACSIELPPFLLNLCLPTQHILPPALCKPLPRPCCTNESCGSLSPSQDTFLLTALGQVGLTMDDADTAIAMLRRSAWHYLNFHCNVRRWDRPSVRDVICWAQPLHGEKLGLGWCACNSMLSATWTALKM